MFFEKNFFLNAFNISSLNTAVFCCFQKKIVQKEEEIDGLKT